MKSKWNNQYRDAVLIALAFTFPIVLSGTPIGDDYVRLYNGSDFYSRLGATWVFQILSSDKFLFNLFPLSQISGITIYAITISWITQKLSITDRLSSNLIILLTLSFPFVFQNYLFQYDCLTMHIGLSIFSITPFIFIPKLNNKIYLITCSIYKILLISLGLIFYQPALISFIIFSIFIYLLSGEKNNVKIKILLWHISVLIIAYLIHYFAILSIGDTTGHYTRNSHFHFILIIDNIISNSGWYIELIKPYYKNIFIIFSHTIIIFFAFKTIYIMYAKNNNSLSNMFITIFSIPILMMITIIIVSIPNDNKIIAPTRILLSMSSAYVCIALIAFKNTNSVKILRLATILAIIPAITILCITTNTASIQAKYERMLITSMYDGLSKIELQDGQKIYFACDHHWFSPYTKKVIDKYPFVMDFILTDHLRKWYFIKEYMGNYRIENSQEFYYMDLSDEKIKNMLQTSEKSTHKYHHYLYDIYEVKGDNNKNDIVVCVNPTK